MVSPGLYPVAVQVRDAEMAWIMTAGSMKRDDRLGGITRMRRAKAGVSEGPDNTRVIRLNWMTGSTRPFY